jgi:hypothetical protein
MTARNNLRGGTSSLAAFFGIGRGLSAGAADPADPAAPADPADPSDPVDETDPGTAPDPSDPNTRLNNLRNGMQSLLDADDAAAEMDGDSDAAQARRREQARCAAIFADAAALTQPDMAATLAFTTRLPRSQAIAILRSAPAGAAAAPLSPLAAAMAAGGHGHARPGLAPAHQSPKQKVDNNWDTAMQAATPFKRNRAAR